MNKLLLITAASLAVLACTTDQQAQTMPNEAAPAPEAAPTASAVAAPADAEQPVQVAENKPVTVSGGSGGTCLAVDVLANDGAFIRAGTAGSLSGDSFTVNGASHDLTGINYSVKDC